MKIIKLTYSIEPRDGICVKGMDFCPLLKTWVKV